MAGQVNNILDYIKEISVVGVIATLGLFISLVALIWNIIRDLVRDRTKLDLKVKFGGLIQIKNYPKAIFVRKGLMPNKEIPDERILFSVVNSGRRPVMIEAIGAKFKLFSVLRKRVEAKQIHIVSGELPRMLQPYEIFNHKNCKQIKGIFEPLIGGDIKYFFVRDTKGKHWKNSRKNTKELLNDFEKSGKTLNDYLK